MWVKKVYRYSAVYWFAGIKILLDAVTGMNKIPSFRYYTGALPSSIPMPNKALFNVLIAPM